jgi:hypothetical protein
MTNTLSSGYFFMDGNYLFYLALYNETAAGESLSLMGVSRSNRLTNLLIFIVGDRICSTLTIVDK